MRLSWSGSRTRVLIVYDPITKFEVWAAHEIARTQYENEYFQDSIPWHRVSRYGPDLLRTAAISPDHSQTSTKHLSGIATWCSKWYSILILNFCYERSGLTTETCSENSCRRTSQWPRVWLVIPGRIPSHCSSFNLRYNLAHRLRESRTIRFWQRPRDPEHKPMSMAGLVLAKRNRKFT